MAGAGLDELDRHRQELLDTGADPILVECEAERAVHIHGEMRESGGRAAELTALLDIAGSLASVRDLHELLGDIAVHARRLLRSDVAYLALVKGDGLQVRFSEGTIGPSIRDVNLSLTEGLAGRIVTTGRAGWTSDYLIEKRIVHHADADRLVADEQLHAILGVPLRARGGVTLGVLFAAERRRRLFADTEVKLLAGLAGYAAVAIENARLFDAVRAAATELRAANDRLKGNAASLDRAIMLHDRLTETVVRGGGPADVVDALAVVLDAPVQLVDAADFPLAGPDLHGPSPAQFIADSSCHAVMVADEDGQLLLCPVVAAEDYLGCLLVRTTAPVDDAEIRLVERGAMGIALTLIRDRAVADATTRNRGEILAALLERGDTDTDALNRRAAAARIDLSNEHVLGVAAFDDAEARDVCVDLARRYNGLVTDRAGRTVLLVPVTADLGRLAAHATVGVSTVVGVAAVPDAYAAARLRLRALLSLGKHHVVGDANALGVYRFLLSGAGPGEAAEFERRTVGPLLDNDRDRGSDLATTLEEYLASGRQHKATAEVLHIHPNTLYQRLDRISAILGPDWRQPDRALDLHVALRLHRLAQALDDSIQDPE